MYTKEQLFSQLKKMNAPQDSVVLMHTALRAVGEFDGRGEGLLDALIEYFTAKGGLFCVPTHTWANLKDRETKPVLDMSSNETCIGTFPNIAAGRRDAIRSLHPTHSMMVFGDRKKAEEFVSGEESIDTSTSPRGCYGKIYENGGYILLVGVGHGNNTYIHSVEEMLDIPGRLSEKAVDVDIKLSDGSIIKRKLHHHIGHVSEKFPKYEPAFRHHGCIVDGFVGGAKTQLCDACKIKDVMEMIYNRSGGRDVIMLDEVIDEKLWK